MYSQWKHWMWKTHNKLLRLIIIKNIHILRLLIFYQSDDDSIYVQIGGTSYWNNSKYFFKCRQ